MTTSPKCSVEQASKRTRILLGCYRKGDCEDPEVYVPAVASVLARYSPEVVKRVTDPAVGLPSTSSWLPTVAEVKRACDSESHEQWKRAEREKTLRAPRLAAPDGPTPEERARVQKLMSGLLAELRGQGKIVEAAE